MSDKPKALAWIDIETTGLDPFSDAILELAIVFTPTFEGNGGWHKGAPDVGVLGTFSMSCRPSRNKSIRDIEPYVFNMHQKSGLWDECLNTKVNLDDVILEACVAMKSYGAVGSPMCGSSVHFDRGFLDIQARRLFDLFHYRNLDVSSIKNMVNSHLQDCVVPFEQPKEKAHRALDDLNVTLEEYRYYLNAFTNGFE